MTIPVATRMKNLGTETAFAVSLEAGNLGKTGKKIYPFHIGDLNIRTPQHIIDAAMAAMKEGKTGYCPTAGIAELREALAADVSASHGISYTADCVSIQPGGKPTINKFILSTMNPGDKVLYPNPGYPIYESQIEFHGGVAIPYGFREGATGFELDMAAIRKGFAAGATHLIYNNYHNPTGASSDKAEMTALAELCIKHNATVLADEAYFDVRYGCEPLSIAWVPGMQERTVILYTFSKKFAMTGWRLGACIGPKELIARINMLNVNDESCTNHFVQYAALAGLKSDSPEPARILDVLRERRDRLVDLLNDIEGVRCYKPEATFYLFPNVTGAMKRKGIATVEEFRKAVLNETGVSFCTRGHFGRPLPGETNQYVRFAYSGIEIPQIEEGLSRLAAYLK